MQEPSVQVYTEQPGHGGDARQTNDTCCRTKTIQNNFINSVTFLLCTSVQPYPLGLLRKIDNACFLFCFFLKGRHKISHQCIIYTSATQSPTPKLNSFTNQVLPTECKWTPQLEQCFWSQLVKVSSFLQSPNARASKASLTIQRAKNTTFQVLNQISTDNPYFHK